MNQPLRVRISEKSGKKKNSPLWRVSDAAVDLSVLTTRHDLKVEYSGSGFSYKCTAAAAYSPQIKHHRQKLLE